MCGRYTLTTEIFQIQTHFGAELRDLPHADTPETTQNLAKNWRPQFNIAPSALLPVVIEDHAPPSLTFMKWGLVPFFAKDQALSAKLNNARSETAHEKPSFREALKSRRCLVPVNGFYEWQPAQLSLFENLGDDKLEAPAQSTKIPHLIHYRDHRLFAFAGLWEKWKHQDRYLYSFCVLTTSPNQVMKKIHDRMPVIIEPKDYRAWLSGTQTWDFTPKEITDFEAYPISTRVNSPKNNDPRLLERCPS